MLKRSMTCIVAIALLAMSPAVFAETQESKAVFDFRIDNPATGATVLKWIQQVYAAKPNQDFVVIFMGASPALLSTNNEGVKPENQKYLDEIAAKVSEMAQDGIQFEACLVAVKEIVGLDPALVLPEITHIANGWIALIEYELDGYAPVAAF